jgi:hypothetical protein
MAPLAEFQVKTQCHSVWQWLLVQTWLAAAGSRAVPSSSKSLTGQSRVTGTHRDCHGPGTTEPAGGTSWSWWALAPGGGASCQCQSRVTESTWLDLRAGNSSTVKFGNSSRWHSHVFVQWILWIASEPESDVPNSVMPVRVSLALLAESGGGGGSWSEAAAASISQSSLWIKEKHPSQSTSRVLDFLELQTTAGQWHVTVTTHWVTARVRLIECQWVWRTVIPRPSPTDHDRRAAAGSRARAIHSAQSLWRPGNLWWCDCWFVLLFMMNSLKLAWATGS